MTIKTKEFDNHNLVTAPFLLGIKAFTAVGCFIILVQLVRGSKQSEGPDKLIYLFAIMAAGAFLLLGTNFHKKYKNKFGLNVLALLIAAIGIGSIEYHQPINGVVLSNRLWFGFGPYVLIFCVLLIPFIFRVLEWKSLGKFSKLAISLAIISNTLLVVLSFWQDSKSVIDPDHSEYVINELFAPLNGRWPYSDFIPQYQSFYGFIMKPFSESLDVNQISNIFFVGLTLLSLLTLALSAFLSWHALNCRSIILSIGLVIPFIGITQFPIREGYLGSIAALLSGPSIRILPGMLLLSFLIFILRQQFFTNTTKNKIGFVFLGISGGIITWQSQDFGIAAVATTFLVIIFASSHKIFEVQNTLIAFIGYIIGFGIYPLIAAFFNKNINFDYFLFFVRQFGSGFGSERIQTPGPILVVLPIIVLLIVIHGNYVYRFKKRAINFNQLWLSSLIGLTFSVWALFGFTYYLNRSYASGQMQILFFPLSISLSALIGILMSDPLKDSLLKDLSFQTPIKPKLFKNLVTSSALPLMLIISLPLASLLLTPNPKIEVNRIIDSEKSPRWPKPSIDTSIQDSKNAAIYASQNKLTIGFFGASSNYVERDTGVKSVSILNSPYDLFMSQKTITVSCEYIYKINPDVLVVSEEGAHLFKFRDNTLCENYIQKDIPGVTSGHFAVKLDR